MQGWPYLKNYNVGIGGIVDLAKRPPSSGDEGAPFGHGNSSTRSDTNWTPGSDSALVNWRQLFIRDSEGCPLVAALALDKARVRDAVRELIGGRD